MRTVVIIVVLSLLCKSPSSKAQRPATAASSIVVYQNDEGLRAPELLPNDFSPLLSNECSHEVDGIVTISLVVDPSGQAKNVISLDPFADDLDRMGIAIAKTDHFSPAIKDGSPVAITRELQLFLALCTATIRGASGNSTENLRLRSLPVQKLLLGTKGIPTLMALSSDEAIPPLDRPKLFPIGGNVSPPVSTYAPAPEITKNQGKVKFSGTCQVSAIVDDGGTVRHVRVIHGINPELD